MGLKILHSADWHLDSPFGNVSEAQRAFLKEAQRAIPGMIADLCRREGCQLVLLSGDLFDGAYSAGTVKIVYEALERCGVPVFISPGNHDFCAPGSPWLEESWPENVCIFKGGLESVTVPELDCRVYGAGYRSMDCPALLQDFHAEGNETYKIAVLHGDPMLLSSPYCPITSAQVRDSGLDYLALGHIHKAGFFRAGRTHCAWPGSPMGRGFDETGEKGIYIVELEEEASGRQILLDTPWFFSLEGEETRLEELLPAVGSRDFYRVTLTGSAETPLSQLYDRWSRFPNLTLLDRREPEQDLWEGMDEDTLEGTYFRLLKEKLEHSDAQTAEIIRKAAQISRRLLSGKEVALP